MAEENTEIADDLPTRTLTERGASQSPNRHPTLGDAQAYFSDMLDPAPPDNSETSEDAPTDPVDEPAAIETAADEPIEDEGSDAEDDAPEYEEEPDPVDDEPRHSVTVNGEEYEVTLDELRNGYMMQSDYSRKTSDLAEQRRAIEAQQSQVEAERQRYLHELSQMQQTVEEPQPDWEALKAEDELEYVIKRNEWREKQEAKTAAQQRYQVEMQQQQQMQMQELQQFVEAERQKLPERIPEWRDEAVAKADHEKIVTYAERSGFAPEELQGLYDSRAVKVLRDAMLWNELQNKQPAVQKKARNAPKVAKPGTTKSKSDSNQSRRREQRSRLKKSGRVEDAAAIFSEMLK